MANENDKTMLRDETTWHPPVPNASMLPTEGVTEGTMCFVTGESAIYQFEKGAWVTSPKKKGR